MSMNKIIFIFILLLVILFLLFNIYNKKDMFNNQEQLIKKKSDNTEITVIDHKWKSDFSHRWKIHEPHTNNKLKKLLEYLPNDSHIVDVGSHVGDTGLYLALILKNKWNKKNIKVIMIDPDESKIDFINKMAKKNKLANIITVISSVSDKTGKSSLLKKKHPGAWRISENNGDIKMDTLDNICKNKNISLLHIDVEGFEYKVLLGSKKLIKNVIYVIIELNKINGYRTNEIKFLEKYDFKMIKDKISKENGNRFFIKNNI